MPPGCGPCPRPLANSAATPAQPRVPTGRRPGPAWRPGGVGDRRGVAGANLHGPGTDAVGHEPQPVWVDHPVTGAFLLAQLRRTLHVAPGAMPISDRSTAPEEQGSECGLGRWCRSVPHLRRKCRGRVLTYSGVARPPLVPGLFQASACASTGHGQGVWMASPLARSAGGCFTPAPESTGAGLGDGRGG
jgi:hypothetical protein